MSYCRWSSENFWSDVYTYAHIDGTWTTHVAGTRYDGTPPRDPTPLIGRVSHEKLLKLMREHHNWMDAAAQIPIGLAHDGKTFKDPDPKACADTLLMLRAAGYNVPQYAIDDLMAEANGENEEYAS